jgi:hypothetical protein
MFASRSGRLVTACLVMVAGHPYAPKCHLESTGAAGPSSPHPGWWLEGVRPQSRWSCRTAWIWVHLYVLALENMPWIGQLLEQAH